MHKHIIKEVIFFALGGILGLLLLALLAWSTSREMIWPNVTIAGIPVGLTSKQTAQDTISQATADYRQELVYNGATITVPGDILVYDIDGTMRRATKTKIEVVRGKVVIPIAVTINEDKYASWSAEVGTMVAISPKPARVTQKEGKYLIENGVDGIELDSDRLKENIKSAASSLSTTPIPVNTRHVEMALSPDQQEKILASIDKLSQGKMTIFVDDQEVVLTDSELVSFVGLLPSTAAEPDPETIATYVKGLTERFSRVASDAKFEFVDGKVQEFAPSRDGIAIITAETVTRIQEKLQQLLDSDERAVSVGVAVKRTPPKITTEQVNDLGINELVGRGESYYAHSIVNRVYNVGLASSRINGALIPPGEEFSFNGQVGEISSATGYKTAYVISGGRTVLGDGGGVCQVSTTLFRAAMDAGLPIAERWPHAYRVGYYEQNADPGKDATVYSPSKDFKFVNDTAGHILVQAINDPKNLHLVFELYGTDDGRVATVSDSRVWGVTPPPPDLYQDDPTLPAGAVRQVDWSAWGAKTAFDYTVTRSGETIFSKTYNSNYQPWQNVYLRGVGESANR